jgi:class 3 adenylate cyclase
VRCERELLLQPEGIERRLATILAADVVGYSRLMAKRTASKEYK